MNQTTPPYDQRSGIRPMAFFLDDMGELSDPVFLPIRPEDLTLTQPSRLAVHQTLGRGVQGWIDDFGQGLPSVTLSGHTGWRTAIGTGLDGSQSFSKLNQMVAFDYHDAKQRAINDGVDPSLVQLIIVDTLNNFTWSVAPTQFVLRRSKSRPLLFQYNITLQCVNTSPDEPVIDFPELGDVSRGLLAIEFAKVELETVSDETPELEGLTDIITGAIDVIVAVGGIVTSLGNAASTLAFDAAQAALKAQRVLLPITSLPSQLATSVGILTATLREIACLAANSLRPKGIFEQHSGILGASNCSSTTGGKSINIATSSVFSGMYESYDPPNLDGAKLRSISALKNMDTVLAPMSAAEVREHLAVINDRDAP